jgi:hypothetical protein
VRLCESPDPRHLKDLPDAFVKAVADNPFQYALKLTAVRLNSSLE